MASNFRFYAGGPGWLYNPLTGAIGYQNRSTGVDVELLSAQTTVAPNLNRVVAKSNNTTGKAAVGDIITVSAPPGVLLSNIQGMQDKSSTGGSATATIAGFTSASYTLTSAEIPPLGATWPITVYASTSNEMADPLNISNPNNVAPPVPGASLRQAASGTYVNETMDSTNFHAGTRLPFTAGVEIPAGTSLRVKFANKAVINNVETNGTGTFTILAASLEYSGVCTAGALAQPTATGGNLAYYDVVVPTTIPKGALFWLSYKVSDGGGMKRFPWYSHSNTNVSKMTIGTTNASVPDQTMVPGGGTWSAVTGGVQSFAIVPVAVEIVHAGKVACVGGSSSGVGRADQGAPGAGVQGYIGRAIAALGYPVKCTAVSGDRVIALAASDAYRIAQLEGVTHHILVVGGNDITDGKTAAEMLAGYQSHINHIKAAWPSIKIMVLTLTPVVTGTYDTLGGQTVVASNSVRISANTQIKANVLTGVDKVADINTLGENTFNPEDGKFPVTPGQMTNDGLHYNTLGCSTLSGHPAFAEFMAM